MDHSDAADRVPRSASASRSGRTIPPPPDDTWALIGHRGPPPSVRSASGEVRHPDGRRKHPDRAGPSVGPRERVDRERLDHRPEFVILVGPGDVPGASLPIGQVHGRTAGDGPPVPARSGERGLTIQER